MKTPLRLLLIVTPIVFLIGLWMGLSKPGWSPRVAKRDLTPVRMLCPPGVISETLKERLRRTEGLELLVNSPARQQDYFRLLYQNLREFDLVCVASHHITASTLSEHFDPLPIAAEWRSRKLHTDFGSVPIDSELERFWPLGWRVLLPTIRTQRASAWATTQSNFKLLLEEDFREVLHFYLRKNLIREDWLMPDHTDPLTSVLSADSPSYEFVTSAELRKRLLASPDESASAPVEVLYVSHTLWHSLSEKEREDWMRGLEGQPGNLQVMGLLVPNGTPAERVEPALRALSHPTHAAAFAESSGWASTLNGVSTSGPFHPSFLRTIPLTQFQWVSGIDPSGLFWERIVASSRAPVDEESETSR